MSSLDGWSINKKLDELKQEVKDNYLALGLRLMRLQEKLEEIDAKQKAIKGKKPKSKRPVTTGDA